MSPRDYNREFRDSGTKYAYDFDAVIRRYMMRTLAPHLGRPSLRALTAPAWR